MLIRWCRTDICSCKLSEKVSLMLGNPFLVPSLCKLNHISVCFIQISTKSKSSHQRCSAKKGVLKNFTKFTGKHLRQSLFFNKVAGAETLAQVFSCEFCEISKNTFFKNTSGRLLLEITCKQLIPLGKAMVFFVVIPGVLGRSVNFFIT